MRFDAFCGPTYASISPNFDNQECINFFPELIESGAGKNERFGLLGTPGLSLFATLPNTPIRGLFTEAGTYPAPDRFFAVGGSKLYEIDSAGNVTERGDVGDDGNPVKFASNTVWGGTHLGIASNRQFYSLNLSTNAFAGPAANVDPFALVSIATYFVALTSLGIQWSSPLGITWDPLDFVGPGGNALLADRKELWVFRNRNMEVYIATSDVDVFQPTPSGFIEQGLLGPHTIAHVDNQFFGLGGDDRGRGVVWSAEGYKPQRVSNHAVESAIQSYSVAAYAGARGYAYQEGGHSFYVLSFPAANATWAFDTTTRMWHKRAYWNNGTYEAHRGVFQTFAFGKQLIADRSNGKVYQQSMSIYDDAGTPIRRLRRSPHLCDELKPQPLNCVQVDAEAGLGLASGQGSDPAVMLRLSGNGGKTWTNERSVKIGKIGEFNKRARSLRWGSPRDIVLELTYSDPAPIRIANVYLNPK